MSIVKVAQKKSSLFLIDQCTCCSDRWCCYHPVISAFWSTLWEPASHTQNCLPLWKHYFKHPRLLMTNYWALWDTSEGLLDWQLQTSAQSTLNMVTKWQASQFQILCNILSRLENQCTTDWKLSPNCYAT